jgi:hypothetical protein
MTAIDMKRMNPLSAQYATFVVYQCLKHILRYYFFLLVSIVVYVQIILEFMYCTLYIIRNGETTAVSKYY